MSIIPPLGPEPDTPNVTTTIHFGSTYGSNTYTVAASTKLLAVTVSGNYLAMFNGDYYGTLLTNNGEIWRHGPLGTYGGLVAMAGTAVTNNGTIVVLADEFPTYDYFNRQQATAVLDARPYQGVGLTNTGKIFAIATNGDTVVMNTDYTTPVLNSGLLASFAPTGRALGLAFRNDAIITNQASGQILAEGDDAIAIRTFGMVDIKNAGLIEAARTPGGLPSIAIHAAHAEYMPFKLENSGTIRGDYAILLFDYYSPAQLSNEQISNLAGGLIEGTILLDLGDDTITNAGTIRGKVLMGEGADKVDTAAGTIDGIVDLGWGDDQYIGSAGFDRALGDNGADDLQGGGGDDLLMGGWGNDTLRGGTGNDGLFGELGNDRIVTQGADYVDGGAGNDRIELGDYGFEYASGGSGFDTLALPSSNRIFDLRAALDASALDRFDAIEMGGGRSLVVRGGTVIWLTGGPRELRIDATATDTLYLVGAWSNLGTVTQGGASYVKYQLGLESVLVSPSAIVSVGANAPGGAMGLDPLSGAAAPVPGTETGVDFTSPYYYLNNYTLSAELTVINDGEIWYGDGLTVLVSDKIGIDLDNFGSVVSIAENDAFSQTLALRNFGTLNNHGTILAVSTFDSGLLPGPGQEFAGFVNAININPLDPSGWVKNYGEIGAETISGVAKAINLGDPYSSTGLVNYGEIYAISVGGFATGVSATKFTNHGSVYAEGGYSAIGVAMADSGGVNLGEIEAVVTGAEQFTTLESIGVQVSGETDPNYVRTFTFSNAGSITADIAITLGTTPQSYRQAIVLTNSGSLHGKVIGGKGDDTILNTGQIDGAVLLGLGNDHFDGTGGTQSGTVDGGDGDDVLIGGSGSDVLAGGLGADDLRGGLGGDLFVYLAAEESLAGQEDWLSDFQHSTDLVDLRPFGAPNVLLEVFQAGTPTVWTRATIAMAQGPALVLRIAGAATTADFLVVKPPIFGTGADDVLRSDGHDTVLGLGGNDILFGHADAPSTLQGGTGDDWYYVSRTGDSLIEFAGEGNDRIVTSVSYTMSAGQAFETLSALDQQATGALSLVGNELGQVILGNAGANTLVGGGGADTLLGLAGNDLLFGNADAASTLQGGAGDDWYYVSLTGDSLVEFAGEGNDRIVTSVSYALSAGQQIETLCAADQQATTPINLTGNEFGQVVMGNAGANTLIGGGGIDTLLGLGGNDILIGNGDAASTLQGGAGDDWYYIALTGDSLVEFAGQGNDRIVTSVSYTLSAGQEIETLGTLAPTGTAPLDLIGNEIGQVVIGNAGVNTLAGGGGADTLLGLGGNDTLLGGDGDDLLNGGVGSDLLDGGAGADSLVFGDALGVGNVDSVLSFTSGQDRLFLENDVFTGLGAGALAAGAFVTGAAAADADDRIIYNSATGALFFDSDGNGAAAAIQFATLSQPLTAADFMVI